MGGLTAGGEEGGRRVYERLRAGERAAGRLLAADDDGRRDEGGGVLRTFRAAGRGAALAGVSLAVSCGLFCLVLVSLCLIPLGVGLITTPPVLAVIREYALGRRLRAREWGGVRIGVAYRPLPPLAPGFAGEAGLCLALLRDPATWRDIGWLFLDCTAGVILPVLAPLVLLYPGWGAVLAAGGWRIFEDSPEWYLFVPVDSQATGLLALALGVVIGLTARWSAPAFVQAYFRLTRAVLAPSREQEMAARINRLTATREDAVDTSAAELRRIERDLHDGAQARLVAVGMDLGLIESLVERDPAKAKELLGKARQSSAEALGELRDLVRGIHPPVLAERGLVDAVRALALRLPVEAEVVADVPGRAEAPVEAAAYFATSELLANAVKHAGADRIWIDLGYREGRLRISVGDNGGGGATAAKGTGLAGVERRLGTFDGVLAVSSPPGGPTLATVELPCVLS
ncbi:histidine kinase [Streptomyces sp. DSM 41982]|uniref:histidine kinase n=1 Tax=Streptomyces evansiae TaxID=3075535 RepID=A0ABD5E088_9ACTN|nr:histidine kinase [Streptomyces sp. DSM 41982]MDT0414062.1 histidine kinase [Streptomyces sp. DSM 41982]